MLQDLEQSSNLKGAWAIHLLILESLPERQEATGAHPADIDTGGTI